MNATDVRKGIVIKMDGDLYMVVDFNHNTPGNWRGMVNTDLRNLKRGTVIQKRFRSGDKLDVAFTETKDMEYLYEEGENCVFMDQETYDQTPIPKELIKEQVQYIPLNTKVRVTFVEGKAVSLDLPSSVVLEVIETEPGVKGDSRTNLFKPATLSTGLVVKVPLFIKAGEKVKIDTRSGECQGRATDAE